MHLTFEDVAVYFSEDEWRTLSQGQRELYKDVMRENLVNLLFLGLDVEVPDIFYQIEQWEKRGASNISKHEESEIVNENQIQKEVIGDRETPGEKRTLKDREPKCLLCRGVFNCYCSLAKTKRKKRFVCVDCGKGYSQEWYLIAHQKGHYRGQPYKCSLCDKSFKKPSHLKRHQKTHTVTIYKCPKCQAEFQTSKDLKEHKAVHQQPKLCSTCGKMFLSFLELKLHVKEAHSKFFECSLCHQLFRYKTDLMHHQREHLVDEVYKCHKCDKIYTRLPYFLRHAEVHSKDEGGDGDHQPKSPPKEPEHESGSSAHTQDTKPLQNQQELKDISLPAKEASLRVVPPDPAKYQGRKFQRKECVSEEFLKGFDVDRLFRCKKCKKCFRHHSTLMRHHLSHSLVLVCLDCGQKFGKMLQLFMHRSKHKRRRPYKCKFCGKAFSVQSLLHLHQHTHSYSKPGHGRGRSSKRPQVPSTETSPKTRKSTPSSPPVHQRSQKNQATKNPSNVCSQDNMRLSPAAKRPYPEVVACNYVKRVCYRPCESRYTM